jgi:hypothetical protein
MAEWSQVRTNGSRDGRKGICISGLCAYGHMNMRVGGWESGKSVGQAYMRIDGKVGRLTGGWTDG